LFLELRNSNFDDEKKSLILENFISSQNNYNNVVKNIIIYLII